MITLVLLVLVVAAVLIAALVWTPRQQRPQGTVLDPRVLTPFGGGSRREEWTNPATGAKVVLDVFDVPSPVEPTGLVLVSVEAMHELLTAAGLERSDQ